MCGQFDSITDPNVKYFLWKISNGWRAKNIPNTQEYIDRINYEIKVIIDMQFVDYFLIVSDILEFADKNTIPKGAGRGCFSPNNRVKVNNFMFKNINDVAIGDLTQCQDSVWRPVEQVFEYDCNEELLTIQTENGSKLDGITHDHEVWVVTRENYERGNLTPEWIAAELVEEGDFLVEQE